MVVVSFLSFCFINPRLGAIETSNLTPTAADKTPPARRLLSLARKPGEEPKQDRKLSDNSYSTPNTQEKTIRSYPPCQQRPHGLALTCPPVELIITFTMGAGGRVVSGVLFLIPPYILNFFAEAVYVCFYVSSCSYLLIEASLSWQL